jgi:hypothetical protein
MDVQGACTYYFKCRNAGLSSIRSVGYRKKMPMPEQSGTGIRGPSSVSECCGTGLRDQMPECRCRLHRHRCRCLAMLFRHTCNIVRIILNTKVWRPLYTWAKQGAGECFLPKPVQQVEWATLLRTFSSPCYGVKMLIITDTGALLEPSASRR